MLYTCDDVLMYMYKRIYVCIWIDICRLRLLLCFDWNQQPDFYCTVLLFLLKRKIQFACVCFYYFISIIIYIHVLSDISCLFLYYLLYLLKFKDDFRMNLIIWLNLNWILLLFFIINYIYNIYIFFSVFLHTQIPKFFNLLNCSILAIRNLHLPILLRLVCGLKIFPYISWFWFCST